MSGGIVRIYDWQTDTEVGEVGIGDDGPIAVSGEPEDFLSIPVLDTTGTPIDPVAEPERWLLVFATKFGSYLLAEYVPPDGEDALRAWRDFDPAKHPKWPKGTEGGKGGKWMPKDGTATDAEPTPDRHAALVDEYQQIRVRYLLGTVTDLGLFSRMGFGINGGAATSGALVYENEAGEKQRERVFIKTEDMLIDWEVHPGITPASDVLNELAADRANEMLGFVVNLGPSVVRDVPGRGWSLVQQWAPGYIASDIYDPEDGLRKWAQDARRAPQIPLSEWKNLALFDCVIGNIDRHLGNLKAENGRLFPIDHGYSWPTDWDATRPAFLNAASMNIVRARRGRTLTKEQKQRLHDYKARMPQNRGFLGALVGNRAIDESVRRVNYMLRYGRLLSESDFENRTWKNEEVDV